MNASDVPCERMDVYMDQHGARHGACLYAAGRAKDDLRPHQGGEDHNVLRRAHHPASLPPMAA